MVEHTTFRGLIRLVDVDVSHWTTQLDRLRTCIDRSAADGVIEDEDTICSRTDDVCQTLDCITHVSKMAHSRFFQ